MARSTGTGRSIPTDTAPAPQHDIPTSTAVTVLCEPDHPSGTWRKEKGAPTATGKQTLPLIQRPGPDQFWNHHPAPPQHPPHSPAGRREVRFREAAPNRNELTPAPAGSAWSSGRRTVNPRNTPAASHVATTCSAALIGCSGSGRRSRRRARGQHPDRLGSGAPARATLRTGLSHAVIQCTISNSGTLGRARGGRCPSSSIALQFGAGPTKHDHQERRDQQHQPCHGTQRTSHTNGCPQPALHTSASRFTLPRHRPVAMRTSHASQTEHEEQDSAPDHPACGIQVRARVSIDHATTVPAAQPAGNGAGHS